MCQCWHPIPEERPNFNTILERLGYCLQDPEVVMAPLPVFHRPQSVTSHDTSVTSVRTGAGTECNSSGNSGSGGSISIGPISNNHPQPHTCDYLGEQTSFCCQCLFHISAISVANLNSSSTSRESETSFSQPSVTSAVVSPGTAETTFIQGVTSVTRPGHGYMRLSSASTALPPPTQPPPKPQTTRQRHSHQWTDSGLGQEPSSSVQVLSYTDSWTALCTLGKLQLEE